MKQTVQISLLLAVSFVLTTFAAGSPRIYELWEPEPAPNNGRSQWESTKSSNRPRSYDRDWERSSYPIGNGYTGASIFGRTDAERVQITDKTLHNRGIYGKGGLTSFAELFLDFNQDSVRNYRRSLNVNEAIAHVSYEQDGVAYQREYFASYPDNVIVIRLTADQKGALSFTVRPEIPYLEMKQRTGTVTAKGNLLTLQGAMPLFSCNFEGQIQVLNEGGSVNADSKAGTVEVRRADAVTLLIATGTNYRLSAETFSKPSAEKLDPNEFPHNAVSARIHAAQSLGYAALKERHLNDYQNLFGRVSVNLNATPSADPTHLLLEKYQQGKTNTWLEELMFQYGRYLLISSSREKSLPANLQGAWSQDYYTPWSGGFWHNINVQMNYWGAMSANLSECFEAYTAFFKAYLPVAQQHAADYVRKHNPDRLDEGGDNGWIIGTGANAYHIPGAGGHSGPGTGGFTAKLLTDYYLFTQDREFLEEVAYPAMLSLSKFYSKALIPHGDALLVEPSASPEQRPTAKQVEQLGLPSKGYYSTAGCTFDQGFVWESYADTLALAEDLGRNDPFLDTIREQITRLDPILIGADGQVKEYREEHHYSDIGDPKHRHISHLCPLFPGTLINSERADWMQAASKTLDLRGNKTTGWALAHRMNSRARLGEGDKAHEAYQRFIRERTVPNLWALHPPFQIDGSLGTMAGVAEMLLQSHEGYINILPALPAAWSTGHFDGLVARGNFVVSAKWADGKANAVSIRSRKGGECRVAVTGLAAAKLTDSRGKPVELSREGRDRIRFASVKGETYTLEFGQQSDAAVASQLEFYVSPEGSDAFAGTSQETPFASLAKARDAVRPYAGKQGVTVHVADGVYYLPDTVRFTSKDSGSAAHPIVYRAANEGGAVLSGGSKLDLNWTAYQDGIFQAKTPDGLAIDQLFINGKAQRMARYPNYDPQKKTAAYQGYSADAFSKERAARWADPTGGYIHAMHTSRWGGYHYRITGKDAEGNVTYEGGWQNNRQMGMHKDYRMVENIFEELDAPGEWFHDAKTSTLYYMPEPDTDIAAAKVEVVRLRHLIELEGTQNAPVKYITLQGFTVRHAARTFMDCKEPLLRSDWTIYRGGAFLLTGTEDVAILDCEFDQVGGNAVFVNNYNRRVLVKGCHIHDAGASGVCFVGDPKAVRDPLFEYNEVNDLSKVDRTPGPKTDNYPADSTVEDCLIHGIGRVERQPAGVQISMAQGITVRDVSIYDCARSGINVSEGTWGGHLIEGCDVFDTVLETHDHGSFNSWGRDRFWHKNVKVSQEVIDQEPELPFLDAVKTTVIRNSRWRCDHGWDIDLDDGSSNYDIYNNLLLASGLKLREGFRRHAWNNVMVNNGVHPHVWYKGSKDKVYGNILMSRHRPARIKRENVDSALVDRNLFFVGDERAVRGVSDQLGWDQNSLFGDPQFVNPANGDFRVQENSPALALGFENFRMDQFGVKKPSLRKIARTPQLPVLRVATQSASSAKPAVASATPTVWIGAKLLSLAGEEFSAFGVSKDEGGVVLIEVPADSQAAGQGLQEGDLVQQVNGTAVRTNEALLQAVKRAGNQPLILKVVRNQQAMEVQISPSVRVLVETASTANGFKRLPLPEPRARVLSASTKTNNDPLTSLTDGKLARSYGPVFANGIPEGIYKMDLGSAKTVKAITSWTCQLGKRGAQHLSLYGSVSDQDPGWDTDALTLIGSIDTRGEKGALFSAASLQANDQQALGEFRWILWQVFPVSSRAGGEHTAFQELHVDCVETE